MSPVHDSTFATFGTTDTAFTTAETVVYTPPSTAIEQLIIALAVEDSTVGLFNPANMSVVLDGTTMVSMVDHGNEHRCSIGVVAGAVGTPGSASTIEFIFTTATFSADILLCGIIGGSGYDLASFNSTGVGTSDASSMLGSPLVTTVASTDALFIQVYQAIASISGVTWHVDFTTVQDGVLGNGDSGFAYADGGDAAGSYEPTWGNSRQVAWGQVAIEPAGAAGSIWPHLYNEYF